MLVRGIIAFSILLQLTAAILSLRLIRVTGRRSAWILIAVAAALMALRRAVVLYALVRGLELNQSGVISEIVALGTSFFMVIGVAGIESLFRNVHRASESLRESEELFRTITEGSLVGVYIVHGDKFRYVNTAMAQIFGYSPDEVIDKLHPIDLTHPDDHALVREQLRLRLEMGIDVHYTLRGLRKDGSSIYCEVLGRGLTYRGQPAVIGTLLDITVRKKAEEEVKARVRQQAAVAELGQRALTGIDIDTLLGDVVAMVAQTLEVEYCIAMQLSMDGKQLLVRAGIDWKDEDIGELSVDTDENTQMGYTLRSGGPVIVEDTAPETRFSTSPFLRERGVVSGLSVTIQGQVQPFGILSVHTTSQHTFTQDDAYFLQSVAGMLASAIVRARTELAVRESEERFRQLAENIDEIFWLVSADETELYYVNPAYERITGRSHETLHANPMAWIEALYPEDRERAVAQLRERDDGDRAESCAAEYRFLHTDGSMRWVWMRTSPVHDDEGKLVSRTGLAVDITELKKIEAAEHEQRTLAEALRDTAAALNSTLEPDDVLDQILDRVGDVVPNDTANLMLVESGIARVARFRGYAEQGIEDWPTEQRFKIEEFHTLKHMYTTKEAICIRDVRERSDWVQLPGLGQTRAYLGAPVCVEGEVIGFLQLDNVEPDSFTDSHIERLCAFADQAAVAIANARLYEESQKRNQRLLLLNEITRAGTAVLDLDELTQILVDLAAKLIGGEACYITLWDAEQGVPIPAAAYGPMRDYYREEVQVHPGEASFTQTVLELGRPLVVENTQDSPHLSPRLRKFLAERGPPRSQLILPLRADERDLGALLLGFNGLHHFTEDEVSWAVQAADLIALAIAKVQAYAELEQRVEERTAQLKMANEHLLTLSRLKDEFVANVSHELRTPIASLKLYHHLLINRSDKRDIYLTQLSREIERLERIIEDLLSLSRMDQRQMPLQFEQVNLNALASRFVSDREALAQERGLSLSLVETPGLPPVQGDQMLIEQVLSILLTNAFNYTPIGGQIEISTKTDWLEGQVWASLSVKDSGPGIPPEERNQIFHRFFRGKAGQESGTPGTGLGLAIAKEILERHNGRIGCTGKGLMRKGATFTIWLPVESSNEGCNSARGAS